MKKIGIVTIFEAINYGAVLQTVALQRVMERLYPHDDIRIVNYRPQFTENDMALVRTKLGVGWKRYAHIILDSIFLIKRWQRLCVFRTFVNQNMRLTRKFTMRELADGVLNLDIAVSGSDQIWNPNLTDQDCVYFLSTFPDDCKKIAYASSMGDYELNDSYANDILHFLPRFSSISVREKISADLLQPHLPNHEIHTVLDPTFLLTAKEWTDMFPCISEDYSEKYVFVFTAAKYATAKELCRIGKEIAAKKKLKVYAMGGIDVPVPGITILRNAKPEEFIHRIAKAEYVVTDSFHGTAFSINFQKPFVSINDMHGSNRQKHLLSVLHCSDQFVEDPKRHIQMDEFNIDYDEVGCYLNQNRKESLRYLVEALEND